MLELADELEREGDRLKAEAAGWRAVAAARKSQLTSRPTYVTDGGMAATETAARHPGPIANRKGPATKLMKELGYSNLAELAAALDEPHATVRAWNTAARMSLPERIEPKVKALRAELARKSAKP